MALTYTELETLDNLKLVTNEKESKQDLGKDPKPKLLYKRVKIFFKRMCCCCVHN